MKKLLGPMVVVKFNYEVQKDGKALKEKFGVKGPPKLYAVTPQGVVVGDIGGYVPPESFEGNLTSEAWNKYVGAQNENPQNQKAMAENLFLLATWFPQSAKGAEALELRKKFEANAEFKAKWDELQAKNDKEVLVLKAPALLKLGRKDDAKTAYREIYDKYPGTPEADEAAKALKKLGVKLDAPAK